MIDGRRVVAWTPYGRERTVSILHRYLAREHARGIVDAYWLYLNTDPDQVDDLRYAYQLAGAHDWITALDRPDGMPRMTPKQRNTGYAYRYMTDPDTVYVRLDDDIIYLHEDAIERLVRAKMQMHQSVACHTLMWNNAITSWYLQQAGVIPAPGSNVDGYVWPTVGGPYCMDPVGWANGEFAVALHRWLLGWIEAGTPERAFLYQDMPLRLGEQFSVSAFASLGSLYAALPQPGVLEPDEEEHWHTVHQPRVVGVPNIIIGNALVSHFTFMPQRSNPAIEATLYGEILDGYRQVAEKLT